MENYHVIELIGEGSFGKVYKVLTLETIIVVLSLCPTSYLLYLVL